MTNAVSATRRYLALDLPWLPAERAMRAKVAGSAAPPDAVPDPAFAVIGRIAGVDRVVAVSAAAAGLGLDGLTLADARARLPALATMAHDAAADAALLDSIADGCERYSPSVATVPPRGIVVDVTGCSAEFADMADLAADLVARLGRHGVTAAWALAATPDAAAALARFGVGDAADLPVAALGGDPETWSALRRAGLVTIGMIAARPPGPIATRFGAAVPVRVARLMGGEDVRVAPRRTPPAVVAEHRCVEPIVETGSVLRLLDRLLAEVGGQLGRRGLGGRRFDLALFRCDGHVACLAVATDRATRDPATLALLFRERLDGLADPLDPGFGYDLVRLAVPDVVALGETQMDLDADDAGDALGTLLDRLTTRLGPARVRRLASGDSHLPERASLDMPLAPPSRTPAVAGAMSPWRQPPPAEPPRRPVQLFTPPQPIEVVAEVPDGPPRRFTWHRLRHDVIRAEGPERIAPEWWRRRDGGGATRDYYRLEDSDGRRFWVFRRGLYGVERPDWFLHGLFA